MTPAKILIFGQGQLGTFYAHYFKQKGIQVISTTKDIRDETNVRKEIEKYNPNLIINAAAKTNIDWCEQNKIECFSINTLGADIIGKIAEEKGIYFLHISSGCVQESKTAQELRSEDDSVHPLCFYSWTKVWAEELLLDRANHGKLKVLLLRPRQLLSSMVSPRNAITKMLTYTKFIDTANSCTIVEDLMWVTEELIKKNATGKINVANPGVITPYEIATLIKEIVKPDMKFQKITKEELNLMTLAKRVDCVLNLDKLKRLGIILPEIHRRLREILQIFKHNLQSAESQKSLEQTFKETEDKLTLRSI